MKCPHCGFVSFDDLPRCKKCGRDLAATREIKSPSARTSLLARLQNKISKTEPAPGEPQRHEPVSWSVDRHTEQTKRELEERRRRRQEELKYLTEERRIREEKTQLRRRCESADPQEKKKLMEQLDRLDRQFEQLQKTSLTAGLGSQDRSSGVSERLIPSSMEAAEDLDVEDMPRLRLKLEAQHLAEEQARLREQRAEIEHKSALLKRQQDAAMRLADEQDRVQRQQAELHRQAVELKKQQVDAQRLAAELQAQREEAKRLATERNRVEQQRQEMERKAETIRRQQEEARRLAAERASFEQQRLEMEEKADTLNQRLAEVRRLEEERVHSLAQQAKLQSEVEQLKKEQEDLKRLAEENRKMAETLARLKNDNQAGSETEKWREMEALRRAHQEATYREQREEWRTKLSSAKTPNQSDYLKLLQEPRPRTTSTRPGPAPIQAPQPIPSAAQKPETPVLEEVIETEEVILEEYEKDASPVADHSRESAEVARKGGLFLRSMAGLIDLGILLLVLGLFLVLVRLISGVSGGGVQDLVVSLGLPFYILLVLLAAIYITVMQGVYGQTLGQRLLGLRVVTTHSEEFGYLTAFIRFVATCFAVGLLGMGVLWIALDRNKQGWHDKLARTVVIRV